MSQPGASDPITPDAILQLGMAFRGSRTLLSAVELNLFTELASGPAGLDALARKLDLHPRSARDFLDALVALGMLERREGSYANTAQADLFLDRDKPTYVGGMLEMAAKRLYPFWGSLTEALQTGTPQNEVRGGQDPFAAIYADPERLEQFLRAMSGISLAAAQAMARLFPWHEYQSMIDIGCAQGAVPVQIALAHPHMAGGGFDLPAVGPIFDRYVAEHGLGDRLRFHPGDFFDDPLPGADVLVMGHILHDWDLEQKRRLLAKAHDALPRGGALIVYEALIDDERRENAFGLLMSLNMLIETPGGFDYTGADCIGWMREAGFSGMRVEHLAGPDSMVIGYKPA
ncbi:MAG: acetylserotonin O-methyltransferase [Pseudomonadota bacterium]|nr:acetylserotonin O-methyltransferase [Pseudomonadota bacterium]